MEAKTNGAPHEAIAPLAMDQHSGKSVGHSSTDVEKQGPMPEQQLQRKLNSRHLQFVAIGMSLGTRLPHLASLSR
jgi:yeast amino acid transporter